ncbi:MAG: hypothetical protein JNL38_33870 [Myxococcales bacterium]|nr:hypothetical protein [Myxococcales bacterium]
MPTWLKIVLVMVGIGVVGTVAVVGGFAWWLSANKDKLASEGKAAMDEGAAYGRAHSRDECVGEGLRRLEECGEVGLMCETTNRIRMEHCIRAAADKPDADPSFCLRVPSRSEIMKSATWANSECARRGKPGSQPCGRLMQGVQQACGRP